MGGKCSPGVHDARGQEGERARGPRLRPGLRARPLRLRMPRLSVSAAQRAVSGKCCQIPHVTGVSGIPVGEEG